MGRNLLGSGSTGRLNGRNNLARNGALPITGVPGYPWVDPVKWEQQRRYLDAVILQRQQLRKSRRSGRGLRV